MGVPSVSEAGDYLTMYLGDGPIVEAFKAEFLRRKESISPELARVVFPTSDAVITDELNSLEREKWTESINRKAVEEENDFEVVRSGKKKGKKGKKMFDPSIQ